ncbi:MAG: S9 family peptidase [Verrucomicrobiota bacterium]
MHRLLLSLLVLAFCSALHAQLPPLIPRDVLFGNPERSSPKLSRDGKRLGWVAPDKKNVLQVWVKTIGGTDDKIVTADKKRGIRQFYWAHDNRTLLYIQDADGDENWHLYGVDLSTGNVRDYTPFQGTRAGLVAMEAEFPNELLLTLNVRDRRLFDVYRLDLLTGALVLDTTNPGDVADWNADAKLQVRAASVSTPEGGTEIRLRRDAKSEWQTWIKVGPEEILSFDGFTADGQSGYLTSSIGFDTARLVRRPLEGSGEAIIAASDQVDVDSIMANPRTRVVEAVAFSPGRTQWVVVEDSIKADFAGIAKLNDGDFQIVSRDAADRTWLVGFTSDRGPVRYYTWDRAAKKGEFMFSSRPKLENLPLAGMTPVAIKARDGLTLHSYLTLPPGLPPKNLPMVLLVHGGPWARDTWGYNATPQWFANRGYACLQVNFRGSTGYGKKFLYAANKEWGLAMHNDLLDAVDWAVKQGYADAKKVAIFGGSYGGYAALAGVTFTPEVFACAVDIVGPSNLKTLIGSIPPYWKPMRAVFDVRMGNVDDPKDAELIRNASPLFKADKIVRPLLIGQGANDPRVKQAESEQIVSAIEKTGGKVTYVLYPDEGHGFARPENRIDFNARAELFLAKHLGGRVERMEGDSYPGSTAIVKVVGEK